MGRDLFDAVQAKLVANNVEKKARAGDTAHLLTGLIYDSAGNRMTPSYSRKKGVRYRYYVSQAILQSRKTEAGEVSRVSAPDIEGLIEGFVRAHCPGAQDGLRALVEAQISRITVLPGSLSIELTEPEARANGIGERSRAPVSLPWVKRPLRSAKGLVAGGPLAAGPDHARDATLIAVGRAKRWVDELMTGGSVADIAKREGKGERQIRLLIPLAFLSPGIVRGMVDGTLAPTTVTHLAKNVASRW